MFPVSESRKPRRPDVTTVEFVGSASGPGLELHRYDERWDDMNDYATAKTDVIVAIKARAREARGQ